MDILSAVLGLLIVAMTLTVMVALPVIIIVKTCAFIGNSTKKAIHSVTK